ncbi:MAG: choice-of-anchor D domain-containing protein, partial [Bacteroidota bacterium]|nr:choice-of-anchor D domain-containing protein [Bacteroidota bacterium]
LDFGSVNIGTTKALAIRITNAGNENLSISGITSSSPRFTVDIGAKDLAPGMSFDDTVRFTPTASGPISAQLTLTSNAPDSPATIPLTGNGLSVVTLSIDPVEVDFGNVLVGSTKDTTVSITNTGNDTLRITSFVADDARFTNVTSIKTILPAGSVNFTLRYSPDVAGQHSGLFTVTSNASTSPDSFTATGTGVHDPAVTFAPARLSFGSVDIGSEGTRVLTISNSGSRSLSVTGIISSNPDFSADERQFDVPGGTSYDDTIRFAPSVAGSRSGFLVISSNAATSPDTVLVEGTGTDVSAVRPLQASVGGFTLYQNYPNPFHPSTTIRYELKNASHVHVTVRNALGQVVATLNDGSQSPGMHSVRWNSGGNAPGIYFYAVRVGGQEAIGTMLLMK